MPVVIDEAAKDNPASQATAQFREMTELAEGTLPEMADLFGTKAAIHEAALEYMVHGTVVRCCWFTLGATHYVTYRVLLDIVGAETAKNWLQIVNPEKSLVDRRQVRLRDWGLVPEKHQPIGNDGRPAVDALVRARYAFATAEIKALFDAKPEMTVGHILEKARVIAASKDRRRQRHGKPDTLEIRSEDLIQAIDALFGVDMNARLQEYEKGSR
jgi:hypothetical protein